MSRFSFRLGIFSAALALFSGALSARAEPNVEIFSASAADAAGILSGKSFGASDARANAEIYPPKNFVSEGFREKFGALGNSFAAAARAGGASRSAFFAVQNGKILFGGVFKGEKSARAETDSFALGRASVVLVSLLSLSVADGVAINPQTDVRRYFSMLRSPAPSGALSLENLLDSSVNFGYAARNIPQEGSAEEFFDALAQVPAAVQSPQNPTALEPSVAAYAVAYAVSPSSKDLKKSFVQCCRKYLFDPLNIDNPRYRRADRFDFPAYAFALDADGIAKWLACETSPNPPFSTPDKIARRRISPLAAAKYSHGWFKVDGTAVRAHCTGGAFAGAHSLTVVFCGDFGSLALSMFLEGVDSSFAEKLFKENVSKIDNLLK